jgi:hypothetical protein
VTAQLAAPYLRGGLMTGVFALFTLIAAIRFAAPGRFRPLIAEPPNGIGGSLTRYRLLETTRAYALEKLAQNGELDAVARRHAEFYRDLFERAETEWETRPSAEWLADYGWRLDNLRAALD